MTTILRRKVKILATLGPASASPDGIRALLAAGADGIRLNASHLKPDDIAPLAAMVRAAESEAERPIALLCDLAGPKLRVRKGTPVQRLELGQTVELSADPAASAIPIEGFDPRRDSPPPCRILVKDGKVVLRVRELTPTGVVAVVERPGEVGGGMGVNLPDGDTSLPSLTDHDRACADAALAAGVDTLALSFVRRPEDVALLRAYLGPRAGRVPIVAKLEKAQAVQPETLVPILAASDMVMVARGDLGAETAPEKVPVLQKQILRSARSLGVAAITATEMLESMIREERPTRAEASDVANALFDGTDAVLLTAETAVGAHPALAVAACASILCEAEAHLDLDASWVCRSQEPELRDPVGDAVAMAASRAAEQLDAAALVCFTQSGRTARLVARYRPRTPILALTSDPDVARTLALVWGVIPHVCHELPVDHEGVVRLAETLAGESGLVRGGELVVVTHGAPIAARSATNLLRIHRVSTVE
ncbi:MAG: pyruvate kinase [Thermoanaerobaculaceae bacterium]|nr:pyruvate kinase [Thermoanaerobaculaceae bacterium]MDI9621791.1 pyruvate kinase [Acidobacteriota bacterium]NLH11689.1 pyruvate kinase [Holophagae bacterium]HPW56519.1 pyruvate kinase [Thermoanaerobaculaceae bacterium]